MKVRIIKDRFGGMGWRAEPGVLHLGGVGTAGVASLSFALPEEWSAEETDRFYEKLLRDKKIARRILIFLIPLLLVFLIDSLVLFLPGLLGL